MNRTAKCLIALAVVVAGAGCMHQPARERGIQPLVTGSPTPGTPTVSPQPPATTQSAGVRVHVRYEVPRGSDTRSLVGFLEAHATSVIRQRVTRQLEQLTTSAELARQRQVVRFAARQHYTVPLDPIARIVSVTRADAGQRRVGVCLWLPSTEYVDAVTGRPPSGQVPQSWVAAIATLHRETVTWKVDSLSPARDHHQLSCGGAP